MDKFFSGGWDIPNVPFLGDLPDRFVADRVWERTQQDIYQGLGVPASLLVGEANSSTATAVRMFDGKVQEIRQSIASWLFPPDTFYGLRVHTNCLMGERRQTRFPRSKKRRIRRKWSKQAKNWDFIPDPNLIRINNSLYGHPVTIEKLKRAIDVENKTGS